MKRMRKKIKRAGAGFLRKSILALAICSNILLTNKAVADEVTVASLIMFGKKGSGTYAPNGTVGDGTWDHLAPTTTLPEGMYYNSTTGLVEGTVMNTDYVTFRPSTIVTLEDSGVRSTNASALSSAIATAAASGSGTVIRIPHEADFGGNYPLPTNNSSGWIYIESTKISLGELPEGTRVTPADASKMPKFYMSAMNTPVFYLSTWMDGGSGIGNGKYRFVGLEFTFAPTGISWWGYADGWENNNGGFISSSIENANAAQYPAYIVVDRCYMHGIEGKNMKRNLYFNGSYMAVIDSYLTDAKMQYSTDGQNVAVTSGPGPWKFVNNYMAQGAAGENIMFGGGNTGIVPLNIETQRNVLDFPLAWHADFGSKNLYEQKVGKYALVQANILKNWATRAQAGSQYYPINLKSTDQFGNWPHAETAHVCIRLNKLENCTTFFGFAYAPESNPVVGANNLEVTANLHLPPTSDFSDHTGIKRAIQIHRQIPNLVINHNSMTPWQDAVFMDGEDASEPLMDNTRITNNLIALSDNFRTEGWQTWWMSSNGWNLTGWNNASANSTLGTFTGNAITQSANPMPSGNTAVANWTAGGFNSTTLELQAGSPLLGTAADGRDPGVPHALLNSALAGVA